MARSYGEEAQQMLELVALVADPARLARGRSLYKRRRVDALFVSDGEAVASVTGSEPEPYEVGIAVRPAPNHAFGVDLVPNPLDVGFSCTCADWGDPCKHSIAVMLQLADEFEDDLDQLARWRGKATAEPPEASAPDDAAQEDETDKRRKLDAAMVGLEVSRGMADPEDEVEFVDPLHDFFTGTMPESGTVLQAEVLESLQPVKASLSKVNLKVDGLDATPIFADLLSVISQTLQE